MNEKKITILIDQDDVLAEYIKGVTEAYNNKYNTSIDVEACTSWNLYSIFGEEVETVMHEPSLFMHLEPVKNALEVFERLYRSDLFEMYIVTAADPRSVDAKFKWIKEYLPFFPEDRVIVCKRKYMVKGDVLLDDGMHNIEEFLEAGGIPIIFDRPHNRHKGQGITRVKDWLAFERVIMEMFYSEKLEENDSQEAI